MGLISWLLKTAISTVVLPISVVSDVFTLWWELNDTESAVKKNLKTIIEDIESIDD